MSGILTRTLLCVAFSCPGLSAAAEPGGPDAPKPVAIEGLRAQRMWMTHMGCLVGCAKYLKVKASPAWIYGGCGHAFALNVHAQLCPSGPTAWCAEKCDQLAANVGLAVAGHQAAKTDKTFATKKEAIWLETRRAVAAGQPCFGWELDVPEWFVITGCDAEGNYVFDKWGRPAKQPHAKLGETEIGWACVKVVGSAKAADDRKTVREALLFAVDHGAGKHSHEVWTTGLGAYELWVKALSDAKMIAAEHVRFDERDVETEHG